MSWNLLDIRKAVESSNVPGYFSSEVWLQSAQYLRNNQLTRINSFHILLTQSYNITGLLLSWKLWIYLIWISIRSGCIWTKVLEKMLIPASNYLTERWALSDLYLSISDPYHCNVGCMENMRVMQPWPSSAQCPNQRCHSVITSDARSHGAWIIECI